MPSAMGMVTRVSIWFWMSGGSPQYSLPMKTAVPVCEKCVWGSGVAEVTAVPTISTSNSENMAINGSTVSNCTTGTLNRLPMAVRTALGVEGVAAANGDEGGDA